MTYQTLLHRINEDLSNNPELLRACKEVLDEVNSKPKNNFRHVTYSKFAEISGSHLDREDVASLTRYLCGDRVKLFNLNFEYIDADTDANFILDEENSRSVVKENAIAHPLTGELIENASKNVFVFFSMNDQVNF